jgi:hypothetical protein
MAIIYTNRSIERLCVETAAEDAVLYRVYIILNASYKVFFLDIHNKYSREVFKTGEIIESVTEACFEKIS